MRKLIFDIETCSYPFESLSETQREYLLKYADKEIDSTKKEAMKDEAIRYTSLYPFTAKCIAIGMYDVEKEKSYVYYESDKPEEWNSENTNVLLQRFAGKRNAGIFLAKLLNMLISL